MKVLLQAAFSNPLLEVVQCFSIVHLFSHLQNSTSFCREVNPQFMFCKGLCFPLQGRLQIVLLRPLSLKMQKLKISTWMMQAKPYDLPWGCDKAYTWQSLEWRRHFSNFASEIFFAATRCYFQSSLHYILRKFPLNDELIRNAVGLMSLSGWKYSGIVCSISDRYNTLFTRRSFNWYIVWWVLRLSNTQWVWNWSECMARY